MNNIILGKFSSWSVISEDIIIKHCDKSIFDHNGSALDAKVRAFWKAERLSYPGRLEIILRYQGHDYNAYIGFEKHQRTCIFWSSELKPLFAEIPHSENNFPDMRFERIGENKYEVVFLNIETIEDDIQDNLESIVEDVSQGQEGRKLRIYTTKYERNPRNRKIAIAIHGTKCMVCGFDFYKT